MKLASIIIPYHKKKNYIKRTIKSALNQTYKNIEIILIYDDLDKKELLFLKKISPDIVIHLASTNNSYIDRRKKDNYKINYSENFLITKV